MNRFPAFVLAMCDGDPAGAGGCPSGVGGSRKQVVCARAHWVVKAGHHSGAREVGVASGDNQMPECSVSEH